VARPTSAEADEISKAVNTVIAMPDVDRARVAIMGHSRGATLALMVAVKRRDLAAVILTAPAPIPPKFMGDTIDRVRSMPAPVLLMVENGDELGGLEATRDIDDRLKRRSKDDHRTIRYDRGGGHFLFIKKDYWWDDLRAFLDEN
jgi:dienelactone hydrolase